METAQKIDAFIVSVARFAAYSILLLIVFVLLQVFCRVVLNVGVVALEEVNWHLYATYFLIGLSYCDVKESHVHIDFLSSKFKPSTIHKINMLTTLLLVFPFLGIVVYHGIPFVGDSLVRMESSLSPSGLPFRFFIKGVLVFAMVLWGLARWSSLLKSKALLQKRTS